MMAQVCELLLTRFIYYKYSFNECLELPKAGHVGFVTDTYIQCKSNNL